MSESAVELEVELEVELGESEMVLPNITVAEPDICEMTTDPINITNRTPFKKIKIKYSNSTGYAYSVRKEMDKN
ncbi:hypothetical protein ACE38V_13760 [Cytobacillus sp. Hz8]|uniref:hypothetical protein n=1 Tax=Cytobacillus sp. Hz8 TaxID=3347168 RepID=UPI0035D9E190